MFGAQTTFYHISVRITNMFVCKFFRKLSIAVPHRLHNALVLPDSRRAPRLVRECLLPLLLYILVKIL